MIEKGKHRPVEEGWYKNLILIDADFLEQVVFDFVVNFERMLGRPLSKADLCHWLDCVALDSGIRQGEAGSSEEIQVVFLHSKEKKELRLFSPSCYETELNGKAFADSVGEFILQSFPVESMISNADFYVQAFEAAVASQKVERVMLVADLDAYGDALLKKAVEVEDKEVVVFTMRPLQGGGYTHEILGYSLMSALGIRSEELG